jgi:hypothetical protein
MAIRQLKSITLANAVDNAKSRYTQGGDTETFNRRLGWWERDLDSLREDDSDEFITLSTKYNLRPDLLAVDIYGSSLLGWLILQFNNIVDINEEFITGKTLRLPTQQRVLFDFLNKRTGGISPADTTIT